MIKNFGYYKKIEKIFKYVGRKLEKVYRFQFSKSPTRLHYTSNFFWDGFWGEAIIAKYYNYNNYKTNNQSLYRWRLVWNSKLLKYHSNYILVQWIKINVVQKSFEIQKSTICANRTDYWHLSRNTYSITI